mgnify:FL=1
MGFHDYTAAEIETALERPVVQRLLELVRIRREHPAFDGELEVGVEDASLVRLTWFSGADVAELVVDLLSGDLEVVT